MHPINAPVSPPLQATLAAGEFFSTAATREWPGDQASTSTHCFMGLGLSLSRMEDSSIQKYKKSRLYNYSSTSVQ